MALFKKRKNSNFKIELLGDDNLADALSHDAEGVLVFPVGCNGNGDYTYTSLRKSAHIVSAGQTGSGMAVFLNTMLTSLMFRYNSDDLQFILIDPKRVSLTPFKDSPYLQQPIILSPEESEKAVAWLVDEMARRFDILTKASVRDVFEYNSKILKRLPYILLVIDEVADLMMTNGEFYEKALVNLMQKSRAVGIFSFIGTHRTDDKVLPGLIRANAFTRIAFTLPTKEASEFIIDTPGAEKLSGKGDLLFQSPETDFTPVRLQAPFLSEDNLVRVIEHCG